MDRHSRRRVLSAEPAARADSLADSTPHPTARAATTSAAATASPAARADAQPVANEAGARATASPPTPRPTSSPTPTPSARSTSPAPRPVALPAYRKPPRKVVRHGTSVVTLTLLITAPAVFAVAVLRPRSR